MVLSYKNKVNQGERAGKYAILIGIPFVGTIA